MKIEALTERYQTRRKTALNRVLVEPEKFATRRREHFGKCGVRGTAASAPHSRLLATTLIVALGRRIRRPAPISAGIAIAIASRPRGCRFSPLSWRAGRCGQRRGGSSS